VGNINTYRAVKIPQGEEKETMVEKYLNIWLKTPKFSERHQCTDSRSLVIHKQDKSKENQTSMCHQTDTSKRQIKCLDGKQENKTR
jgi:hypothetical protein